MIIKYINVKYSYLKINNKIKNEFSYIYEDKYLNDIIYVLNSNLIRQSFLRKKHLMPWWFTTTSKNISVYKNFSNKWDIFNVYPIKYTKTLYNKRLNQEHFYYHFYRKLLKSREYSEINFKYLKRDVKYFIKWRKKQFFARIFSFYKVFKQIKKFWKRGLFVTYNGHVFSISRKFMRLKKSFSFFRKNVKSSYRTHFKLLNGLLNIILNDKVLNKYSFSKLFIYYSYLTYIFYILKVEFKKLQKTRLNKKGPFYSIFKFKRKPLRIINFFFQKVGFTIFNSSKIKMIQFKNKSSYKLLQFYYLVHNTFSHEEWYKLYYLKYITTYSLLEVFTETNIYQTNYFLDLWSRKTLSKNVQVNIVKRHIWKKYRKSMRKKRIIFKQPRILKLTRQLRRCVKANMPHSLRKLNK